MENKQKPVERETRQLIQTYNVLLKSQIYPKLFTEQYLKR